MRPWAMKSKRKRWSIKSTHTQYKEANWRVAAAEKPSRYFLSNSLLLTLCSKVIKNLCLFFEASFATTTTWNRMCVEVIKAPYWQFFSIKNPIKLHHKSKFHFVHERHAGARTHRHFSVMFGMKLKVAALLTCLQVVAFFFRFQPMCI